MDLGCRLARVGPQNSSGVLDQPALEGNRSSKEQRVQHGTVEPLAHVRPGGDDKQRWLAGLRVQAFQSGGARPGAHAAAEHDGVVIETAEELIEALEMGRPLGQEQAVPVPGQRGVDIGDNLRSAGIVGDQFLVDSGDSARLGRIRAAVAFFVMSPPSN